MLAAYADATVEVDRHGAPRYDLGHRPRHQAGKWVARHLQGAAGRKTSAAGRRGGTLSPRAAGPSSGARRCFSRRNLPLPERVHAACARSPPSPPSRLPPPSSPPRPRAPPRGRAPPPAAPATWTPPATVSAPHTFISPLDAARGGNGTAVLTWGFQEGIGAN